ncbi:extracellular solute-binding protein [Streptomyces yaizuensis]|uniref:Extracellular solute-binding protein n=1 Tax=Streptomyces yaizuensis TaxID=2989713 RepID=A0ABQ5NQZ4_9ACTN|nr:extracellular solute-binding protein [Streptomyces sp. YSPA8]GLF92804.1 extracellular solute-binding protein [Streptomyces sp. YSPA8]
MKIRPLPSSLALAAALALTAGCGLIPGTGSDKRTVEIWLMQDSVSDDFLDRFVKEYEKDHPSVDLKVTFQPWTGIGKKVNAALEGTDTPDVIEVGNTQVAQYAETDALMDLTLESVRDLGSEDWLPGLKEPGNINGSQYGIPWYAANRVVIYNKDLFEKAGITKPPRTRDEWLEISEQLNTGGDQGIYLAGQDWYTLAGFIWDEGGDLAVERGGAWDGALHTEKALRGMEFYKQLQSHGKGPKNADEQKPPQTDVFARGDVAQLIAPPSATPAIEKANPALKGKLGYFSIPGLTEDKPGAVFTGGSDLIIPERAGERAAAVEVVKALASERWQTDLARTMNYVPNKQALASVIQGQESTAAMAAGANADGSQATPTSPKWADVEVDNPIKPFMTKVLEGGDPGRAAKQASEKITAILAPG